MKTLLAWAPALVLGLGAAGTVGVDLQRALPLRAPLEASVPAQLEGRASSDLTIDEAELAVAAPTNYLLRQYEAAIGDEGFSVYVGYYDEQARGKTIHSPKNCLPGAGWEALQSRTEDIPTADGTVRVNRYLLQNGTARAVVLYWYQGRGRVEANEYRVKWNLLRDAALRQRSDEALVRIAVPVVDGIENAADVARRAAQTLVPALDAALPS